jgi:mono/diheme cytochrome c family protein
MPARAILFLASAMAAGLVTASPWDAFAAPAPDFNREVRPLLSDRCFACHGPDEHERKAGLRLDSYEGATEDRDGSRAIDPAAPAASALLARVTTTDPDDVMPPPDSGKVLSAAEVEVLRRWVEGGAPYQTHWAFAAPARPAPPETRAGGWARVPLDQFVLAALEAEGLSPEPEAEPATLARRVALDLTGLPPDPDELAAFLAEPSPGAYGRFVDRLLESPRFGEHRARYWLDAARYGDTHGLHLDNYREIYPYRDWVVGAFNANLRFDAFVTEQLAGDLLPASTLAQRVASGFNRAHVTTAEGGSIAEEVYVRNVKDRVDTFGTVFLGLTAGCASCHNHKYDPLTQREYYSLFAYFNSLDDDPLDGNVKDHAPVARVPTPDQAGAEAGFRDQIAAVREEVRQRVAAVRYEEPAAPARREEPRLTEFVWVDDGLPDGARPDKPWTFRGAPEVPVHGGEKSHSQTADGLGQHFFTGAATPLVTGPGDRLFAHVFLDPAHPPEQVMLQWNDGTWEHRAYWGANKIDWGTDGTPSRLHRGPLPHPGAWARLEVDAASVGLAPGAQVNGWAFTQFGGTVHWDTSGIVTTRRQDRHFDSLARWVDYQRTLEAPDLPDEIKAIVQKSAAGGLSDEERASLTAHFVEHVFTGTRQVFEPLHEKLAGLERSLADLGGQIATTLVSEERAEPRASYVLERGEYDRRGEAVGRVVPAFLPPLPEGAPNDRLGLARWLVAPEHPLFARVAVNRMWQELFGTGIVKTSEDFGLQGDAPGDQALLDWLAVEFRESGWDTKRFYRMLVTSATYRQSSAVSPEKLAADPGNRLLSRGPRFRLDAEALRDQALAVSGLLVERLGGPPVKPPQPPGLWEAVGYSGSNTVKFVPDSGPDKVHRRSLYTFWKRTAPPPQMGILDAPSRESCTVRRERTNTPLQALMLMNDPQYFEAARHLGERALREGGGETGARLRFLFRTALGREPSAAEMGVLRGAHDDHRAEFAADPDRALRTVEAGGQAATAGATADEVAELATFTMLANLVLNLDEFVTKN